jgi:hypothetical protein
VRFPPDFRLAIFAGVVPPPAKPPTAAERREHLARIRDAREQVHQAQTSALAAGLTLEDVRRAAGELADDA